jgi:hypothetical protein
MRLQGAFQVSAMVQQSSGVTLRIASLQRPHESAVLVDPTLEDAYLLVVGEQALMIWTLAILNRITGHIQ